MLGRSFYIFTGIHSFLIGLFPFYIPVYLYTIGLTLNRICFFVAVTGAGFCLALFLWDRLCRRVPFHLWIVCSFFSEILLLSMFFLEKDTFFILVAGLVNGFFNCNFWIIQRLLFVRSTGPQNSGRNFGNSQIYVFIILKAGILLGGFLLEESGFIALYLISASIVLLSAVVFSCCLMKTDIKGVINQSKPISLLSITRFKDGCRSRSVFGIDGVLLYFESYYWLLSLFFIVRENFLQLGLAVIILAILFGFIFLFIKSNIDSLPEQMVYRTAVALYAISWVLRGILSDDINTTFLLVLLLLIAICTALFRLSFNKRFFDNAEKVSPYEYILMKSYFSQFFLALFLSFSGEFFPVPAGSFTGFPGCTISRLSSHCLICSIEQKSLIIFDRHTSSLNNPFRDPLPC